MLQSHGPVPYIFAARLRVCIYSFAHAHISNMPPRERRTGAAAGGTAAGRQAAAAVTSSVAAAATATVTVDAAAFRAALAAFWRDAHDKHCGMISRAILPPLAEPPPSEVWAALVAHEEHPVAQALAKASAAPLLVSLNGWLAALALQPPESRLDGAAVGAALAARFVRSHLADTATLRSEMARLVPQQGDRRRERKVWAAAENMPLREEDAPSPLQRGVIELYDPEGGRGTQLAAALYAAAADGKLFDSLDLLVNCVKDLADLASRYDLPPLVGAAPAAPAAAPVSAPASAPAFATAPTSAAAPVSFSVPSPSPSPAPAPAPVPAPSPSPALVKAEKPSQSSEALPVAAPATLDVVMMEEVPSEFEPSPPPPSPFPVLPAVPPPSLLAAAAAPPPPAGFRRDLRLALEKTRTMYAAPLVP